MSIHSGHRRRVKEEYLAHGLEGVPDHKALELLLFYAIPQGDVNELAHTLIDRFGSLAGVLDAPVDELVKVPGVGEHSAILLNLIPALGGRYLASRSSMEPDELINTSVAARRLFAPYFFGARNEQVYMAALSANLKLLGVRKLSQGTVGAVDIVARNVIAQALSLNASVVLLAHNHPSGFARPSPEDKLTTQRLKGLLAGVDIDLRDHLIFVDDDMVSMRDSGLMEAL